MKLKNVIKSVKNTAKLFALIFALTIPTMGVLFYNVILGTQHRWTDSIISVIAILIAYSLYLKTIVNHDEYEVNHGTLWISIIMYIGTTLWLTSLFMYALLANFADPSGFSETDKIIKLFYYCVSTLTTLGYGDIHPYNHEGMIIASAMSLLGTANMIFPIAIITSKASNANKRSTASTAI